MFKFIAALVQPLKTLYIVFMVGFLVVWLSVVLGAATGHLPHLMGWAFGGLGLITLLIGICMVADINGSARSASQAMKAYKPFGVDYSQSWLSSVGYVRVFGAFAIVVGGGFIVASVTQPGFSGR